MGATTTCARQHGDRLGAIRQARWYQRALALHAFQEATSVTPMRSPICKRPLWRNFPKLDTLVSNAGMCAICGSAPGAGRGYYSRDRRLRILAAPCAWSRNSCLHLLTRPDALIVNVSSGPCFHPLPSFSGFTLCGEGRQSLHTQSLRVRLRDTRASASSDWPLPARRDAALSASSRRETRSQGDGAR